LTILGKHKNNLFQMEALLFGQANLLSGQSEDVYHQSLQKEYSFLQAKYGLNPVYSSLRFLRMRPQNFPTVRLAQLAMLIHQTTHLFSFLLQSDTVQEVKEAIAVTASDYWNTHYTFTKTSVSKPKKIGTHTLNHLFINTFVPLLFAYGTRLHAEEPKVKAIKWLETLPAEENWITKNFRFLSVNSRSAFDSQALIELKNEYCSQKRCLECAIGTALLKKEAIV
jgi:hypothetical protein